MLKTIFENERRIMKMNKQLLNYQTKISVLNVVQNGRHSSKLLMTGTLNLWHSLR